jgi:hypothetical protein
MGTVYAQGAQLVATYVSLLTCGCCCRQDRNIQSSTEWRQQLGEVDKSILDYMRSSIKGGFDEERHSPRIGFGNLKRWAQCSVMPALAV